MYLLITIIAGTFYLAYLVVIMAIIYFQGYYEILLSIKIPSIDYFLLKRY